MQILYAFRGRINVSSCFVLSKTSFSGVNNWALQYSCMLESRYSYTSPMLPSFHDSYHLQILLCAESSFLLKIILTVCWKMHVSSAFSRIFK